MLGLSYKINTDSPNYRKDLTVINHLQYKKIEKHLPLYIKVGVIEPHPPDCLFLRERFLPPAKGHPPPD